MEEQAMLGEFEEVRTSVKHRFPAADRKRSLVCPREFEEVTQADTPAPTNRIAAALRA
jgi:RNA-binding protein YlmH